MEWFRFDCNITHGKIAQRLRKKFKSAGFDFYLMIWDDAHRTDDYYLPWDDDDIDLYCDELQIDEETGREIFDYLIEKRIFYRIDHPRFGTVLTNETIQRGFIPTANERARKRAKKTGDSTYPVDGLIWILPEKETGEYIIPTDYGYTPRSLPGSSTEHNHQFPGSSTEPLGNTHGSSDTFHVQTDSTESTYRTDTTDTTNRTDIPESEDRKGESEGETHNKTANDDYETIVCMYLELCDNLEQYADYTPKRLNNTFISKNTKSLIDGILKDYTVEDVKKVYSVIIDMAMNEKFDSEKHLSFQSIMNKENFQKLLNPENQQ